ncbi:ribose ABC transporter permease [Spirochaetia bacterium]|nr:ribose ABC transporter permease [Spirochaetia bacterium]
MKTAFAGTLKKLFDKYTTIIILLALIVLFSFFSPVFFTWTNLRNLVTQNTYYIIAAIGLAFVMIGGGIDLSVGYQMSLVGVVLGMLITVAGVPVPLALAIGFVLGAFLGALNGALVTSIRIFPLIATLATSTVFQGISYTFSQSKTYRPFPASFRSVAMQNIGGVPFDVILVIVIALIASYVLQKTYFGRYVMAVGGNEEVARLSGINTKLIKTILYGICGFCFAIATWVMLAKSNTASSSMGPGTEFTGLTAAIIGGISFKGGKGTIAGLVIGVFIVQIIGNGMQLAGWGVYSQYIVKGIILIMAVALDSLKNK